MFITRLIGVLGGHGFVSVTDPLLKDEHCPEDVLKRATALQLVFETTAFDIAFSPMAQLYAEPAAIISRRKEAEFMHDLYFDPSTVMGSRLAQLTEQLGDVPLSDYLAAKGMFPVRWHVSKAWREMRAENALHAKDHTVLAVGPSGLMAALGLVALGKNRRRQEYSDFIKRLLSCDPQSFSCYDIGFDTHGTATYAKFISPPAEEATT